MSNRSEKYLSLLGNNYSDNSNLELSRLFVDVLKNGMHGVCFSMYEDGQQPGDIISVELVRRRVEILKPYTSWIRSFSCIEGNEHIPVVAKQNGIKTMVGAWLSEDHDKNIEEIEGLIALAKNGMVDIAAVGNEVLYRGDLSEDQLLSYLYQVKAAIPEVTMGYVDAYYEFRDHPKITEACDVVLANCYPYWEGCHIDYSLIYMKQMYQQALAASQGKQVIITETGWPSHGSSLKSAHPSEANAMKYFMDAQQWSKDEEIAMFYFSSFDESWKVGDEGDVGAYWGIWDKNEKLKFIDELI